MTAGHIELTIYAVRNKITRKFYRSYAVRRYAGTGWEDDLADAKLYTKPGPARGCVTRLMNEGIDAEVVTLSTVEQPSESLR